MKRGSLIPIAIVSNVVFLGSVYSQVTVENNGVQPDTLARKFRVDFAIPDAPSFELLDANPSSILRPTTAREFTIAFSEFVPSGSSITLPGAFGVEFSPGLIINGRTLSCEEYEKGAAWYRLRVSAATKRTVGAATPTEIAVGVRTSIVDESDLRCNKGYVVHATEITRKINDIYLQARLRVGPQGTIILNEDERQEVNDLNEQIKAMWADERWNKTVLDVAFGMKGAALDSTGTGFRTNSVAGWVSWSLGLGDWGQCLLGSRLSAERDYISGQFLLSGSVAGRLYIGGSAFKGFIEGQVSNIEKQKHNVLLNSGAEAGVWKGGWVTFSGGLEFIQGEGDPTLTTNMKVNLGLADLIGL